MTVDDMLKQHNIASSDKDGKLKLLRALLKEYWDHKEVVFEDIQRASETASRLEEIGLGRSVLDNVAYIERLIEAERKSDKPNKVECLRQLDYFKYVGCAQI